MGRQKRPANVGTGTLQAFWKKSGGKSDGKKQKIVGLEKGSEAHGENTAKNTNLNGSFEINIYFPLQHAIYTAEASNILHGTGSEEKFYIDFGTRGTFTITM